MNRSLPIFSYAESIASAVRDDDVVIISAETGSGKSTQVPQMLLDAGQRIIVTEPRRIACATLCERVRREIGDPSIVGYETAFEAENAENARILFCTDGLVLARGLPREDDILIIDEIHEWNINVEALLALIRERLGRGLSVPRTVLMSATMDADGLAAFLAGAGTTGIVKVQGRTARIEMHHVAEDPEDAYMDAIIRNVADGKSVLAFRPGKGEIASTIRDLRQVFSKRGIRARLMPMHAELGLTDQERCFEKSGIPKVVVATNGAQTSLTIPDIDVVVDDGLERRTEDAGGMESLILGDVAQDAILQRAGRAGRVADSEYWLCSPVSAESRPAETVPDIRRLSLDHLVLRLKAMGFDADRMEFFHTPGKAALAEARERLEMLGAIKDGELTEDGRIWARYPVSARSAKLIEEGKRRGVGAAMIAIASLIEAGGLIRRKVTLPDGRIIFPRYGDFTNEKRSDLLAELDVLAFCRSVDPEELETKGVIRKAFEKAAEIEEKLLEFAGIAPENISADMIDQRVFLECLHAAYPDYLFVDPCPGCGNEYEGRSGSARLSDISCACSSHPLFVFGFHRSISFKDRWGRKGSMEVIEHVSEIPDEWLLDILDPDMMKVEDETIWYFDDRKKAIEVERMVNYLGVNFIIPSIMIDESDPAFPEYEKTLIEQERKSKINAQEYSDFGKKLNDGSLERKDVPIGGIVYRAIRSENGAWHLYFPHIREVPDDEIDIGIPGVTFHLDGAKGKTFAELKTACRIRKEREAAFKRCSRLTGAIFNDPEKVIEAVKKSPILIEIPAYGQESEILVIGACLRKKGKFGYRRFSSVKECEESLPDAIRGFLWKWSTARTGVAKHPKTIGREGAPFVKARDTLIKEANVDNFLEIVEKLKALPDPPAMLRRADWESPEDKRKRCERSKKKNSSQKRSAA